METPSSTVYFSPRRVATLARNTMVDVIRQKFFYILVIFGIAVLGSSRFFAEFSSVEQIKFTKDFSLAVITIFGALIAMVGTAELLPLELDNRTIYPILAKPVVRIEFLLGKFFGMVALLLLTIILMSVIFAGLLFYTEQKLIQEGALGGAQAMLQVNPEEAAREILRQTRDPGLLKAMVLIYFKAVMISGISLLISTFATSVIFNVISTFMVYLCGHLEIIARQSLQGDPSWGAKTLLLFITFFVPDLNAFNVADAVVLGNPLPWSYIWKTVGYGAFYTLITLVVAYLIFEEKEI